MTKWQAIRTNRWSVVLVSVAFALVFECIAAIVAHVCGWDYESVRAWVFVSLCIILVQELIQSEYTYASKCAFKGCNFRVKGTDSGSVDRIVERHFDSFHNTYLERE